VEINFNILIFEKIFTKERIVYNQRRHKTIFDLMKEFLNAFNDAT